MPTKQPARIDGILAREAPVAVVFRRGPSKLTQQLLWNLETDDVTPGQWIKGRVHTDKCDLSPDGRYLVASITNYSKRDAHHPAKNKPWLHYGWTAVSRPPYFSALALWFTGGAWNGGGVWVAQDHLIVDNGLYAWKEAKPPRGIRVSGQNTIGHFVEVLQKKREPWPHREDLAGWNRRKPLRTRDMNKDGFERFARWFKARFEGVDLRPGSFTPPNLGTLEEYLEVINGFLPRYQLVQEGIREKPFDGGLIRVTETLIPYQGSPTYAEIWQLLTDDGVVRKEWKPPAFHPHWVDVDHRGRILFGEKGCLFAWEKFPDSKPKLVADLNGNTFEQVPPPACALEW